MVQYGRSSRSFWAISARSPFGRTVMGKATREDPYEVRLGEGFQLGMSLCTSRKRTILICVCGWHKIGRKETEFYPMWKILNKEVDLGEPTSFLDHVYLGCTQRQSQISKDIVDNYRTMFESRISAGRTEKLPFSENLHNSSWSYDMEGHAKQCVERYCELANKTTQQLYKVSTPCIDDHHFKEEELKSVGDLSKVCSQIVLKCLYLARIGRPDILWSVNKLARSITKWTKACDNWFHIFIVHLNTDNIVMWEILLNNAVWDCFKTPILREILRIQNALLAEHCAFWEVIHLFQEVVCARNKLQFHTGQQNPKSSLWSLDWD